MVTQTTLIQPALGASQGGSSQTDDRFVLIPSAFTESDVTMVTLADAGLEDSDVLQLVAGTTILSSLVDEDTDLLQLVVDIPDREEPLTLLVSGADRLLYEVDGPEDVPGFGDPLNALSFGDFIADGLDTSFAEGGNAEPVVLSVPEAVGVIDVNADFRDDDGRVEGTEGADVFLIDRADGLANGLMATIGLDDEPGQPATAADFDVSQDVLRFDLDSGALNADADQIDTLDDFNTLNLSFGDGEIAAVLIDQIAGRLVVTLGVGAEGLVAVELYGFSDLAQAASVPVEIV